MSTKINPELVAVVLDATKGEIAKQLAAGDSPCGWNGCPVIATHLLVVEAWGDG